jgi:uncharacterized damage-inducible protein DinB
MGSIGVDQYRRWYEYEKDSHRKALVSLTETPPTLRPLDAFQKALGMMSHIIAARRLWLYRLGGADKPPKDVFSAVVPLDRIPAQLDAVESAWTAWLDQLTDEDLSHVLEYRSLEGDWYRTRIEDILTQLFGHSWYHRGQIATLLRSIQCVPASTDFIFWAREPMPAPAADRPAGGGT